MAAPAPPAGPPPARRPGRWATAAAVAAALGVAGAAVAFAWRPVASAVALERGRAALDRHDPRAAADLLAAAAERDPRNGPLAFAAVRAARRAGDFADDPKSLAPALDRAARLGADPEAVRRERTLAAAAAGRLDGPDGVWGELPGLLTDDRGDLDGICAAYVNGLCLLHRFDTASGLLDQWESVAPGDAEIAYRRGLIALSLEDPAEAERQFRAALDATPWRAEAAVKLAEVLRTGERGDAAGAARLLATFAADSDDPALLEEYGADLKESGRPGEAVRILRRAADLAPADLDLRRPLAESLMLTGEPAAALDAVDPLLAAWPDDLRGNVVRANALRSLGRREEAAEAFGRLQSIERARGDLYALAREANDQEHVDPAVLYRLGHVVLEYEDRSEGVAYLTAALRLDPRHGPTHAALAKAHDAAGRPEFASRHRRLAARYGAGGGTAGGGAGK